MNFSRTIPFLLILVLFSFSNLSAVQFLPVSQNEYQFIYEAARRNEIRAGFYYNNYNVGPYDFDKVDNSLPHGKMFGNFENDKLKLFSFSSENFRSAKYSRAEAFESMRGGFIARPIENIYIYSNFLLDEKLAKDPGYSGKKWRGLAGEVENAFISYSGKKFDILFGRFGSFWGPSNQPPVLSSTARPMDAFSLRLNWGRLNYTYLLARLERFIDSTAGRNTAVFHNRFFAGHRLDFRALDNLNLGFFETIIFSGEGRSLELNYLNPLLFYHSAQLNENLDDNTFLGMDFSWYLFNRHKLYGQIMIDDYQIDENGSGDKEPNEIGYILGIHSIDFLDYFDIQIEYLKITNRTFNQRNPANRYINRGGLIGNEFGPDGDKMRFTISKWFENVRRISANLIYVRNGEGRYFDVWDEPWLSVEGDYYEPFPTGVVEKNLTASINFSGFYKDILFVDLTAGLSDLSNVGHIENNDLSVPFFKLHVSIILSALIDIE